MILSLLGSAGCQDAASSSPSQDPLGTSGAAPAAPAATGGAGSGASTGVATASAGGATQPLGAAGAGTGIVSGAGGAAVAISCDTPPTPRAPIRRITRFEYNNTVRDLLGVTSRPADALPGEEAGSGFGNDADALGVSRLLVDGYRTVAAQIAEDVTADPVALVAIAGCDPTTGEAACQQTFLERYLTRAFRHPPDATELAAYDASFVQGQTLGGDFASGARAVIERSLQSPQFLYRVELGQAVDAARGLARPTGYEMATRLSYLLWGSTPDEELLDAAAQGALDTDEGVSAAAQRLLADDKAKESLRYFHGQLFGIAGLDYLERDSQLYPAFLPGMGALFRQETERFLDHVIWEGEGDLSTIFSAPYTFVNESLATFYGITGVAGEDFVQVPLDTTQRAGLLTQASILTVTTPGSRSDPVVRGKWLYTKALCGTVPDPPGNIPEPPAREPGEPVRDWLARHRSDPACTPCHQLMDPLGLAFEHFDGVGLWRDTDNDVAIDDSGEVPISDIAGPFQGAVEFGQKLAQSQDAQECYVGRYLTYAYGRALSVDDECSRLSAETAFQQTGGNVQQLLLAVTQTDGFLSRPIVTPGQ